MNFWTEPFRIEDKLDDLKRDSKKCEFCKMRWALCDQLNPTTFPIIHFDRHDSMIRLNEGYPPAFTVNRRPDFESSDSMRLLQIGFPELSEAGTGTHFSIIREWLKYCDAHHPNCKQEELSCLPTRLIDVGDTSSPTVKLYETRKGDKLKYIALSHPWGRPPHFCTYTSNIEEHKKRIDAAELPMTFQHAVAVTRALGIRYLWIDSICIIQGPDGDFSKEAKRMEDVFSMADCVLAASCAKGQYDGFLKRRAANKRKYLTFQREGQAPVYVSEFVDDFENDVIKGHLNQRGWVLQERALARRTIYFTQTQTYWECGGGVRCETLTKMDNKLASFLGDPSFPKVAIESTRGGKILLYQDLYRQYSRLDFTHQQDRPIAVAGLEKRLIQSFGVHGGFGVFDDSSGGLGLLRRSLLWQRGADVERLERIAFGVSSRYGTGIRATAPPSWSWMAHGGGIEYVSPPFDGVDWEGHEIRSPWAPGDTETWHSADEVGVAELSALARSFDGRLAVGADARVVYDDPSRTDGPLPTLKCIVLGKLKSPGKAVEDMRLYVMVVALDPAQVARGAQVYERVGVGYMPGKAIDLGQKGTPIKIR